MGASFLLAWLLTSADCGRSPAAPARAVRLLTHFDLLLLLPAAELNKGNNRQAGRQTGRQTDRQTFRQKAGRQAGRQGDT